MAILGPIIQAARGGIIKYNNAKLIDELRSEALEDILDGFSETEKQLAIIKFKEVELELAVLKNEPRRIISKIEEELIILMSNKMDLMENELKKETATKYDLASTVISFQKANREVKDYLVEMDYRVEDKVKNQENRLKEKATKYDLENTVSSFQKENKDVKYSIAELEYRVEDRVKNQENKFEETKLVYNKEFKTTKEQIHAIKKELEIKENEIAKLNQKFKNIVIFMTTFAFVVVIAAGYYFVNM